MGTIAVTGASGKLGGATIGCLLERKVAPSSIVAIVRDPAKVLELAARGVEIRRGDYNDPASLENALRGVDRLMYKYLLIPIARKRLAEQGRQFAWAGHRPRWGPGRDAPMNLTKFNFLQLPMDSSVDNTDFPSIWALGKRVQPGRTWPAADDDLVADWKKAPVPRERLMLMNLDGATTSFRSAPGSCRRRRAVSSSGRRRASSTSPAISRRGSPCATPIAWGS